MFTRGLENETWYAGRFTPGKGALPAKGRFAITIARNCEMTTVLKVLWGVCAVFLVEVGQIPSARTQVPGFRGIDHIGLTVPNLEEAVDFFVNVIGCEDFFFE